MALRWESQAYFQSRLKDEAGKPLRVDSHHEEWANLAQSEPFIVALAPRDHSKTWTFNIGRALHVAWRHNRDPETGQLYPDLREGLDETVVFSATLNQAEKIFESMQGIMLANPDVFGDLIPFLRGRTVWSRRRMMLRNGVSILIRAYRTSVRGMHPTRLILDDVLSDENSLTAYQRGRNWDYFMETLLPMNPEQIIVVGTAFHYDDLLHRLRPTRKRPMEFIMRGRRIRVRWLKYRAVNWDTGRVLWPWRHDLEDLRLKRLAAPLSFAREYQNDPVDDTASIFPRTLTERALTRGATMRWFTEWVRQPGDFVIVGHDLALGVEASSDYTVAKVVVWNRFSGRRVLLWAERHQGLGITDQIALLRALARDFDFDLAVVEENGFQRWLLAEVLKDGQLNHRVIGHRTGTEKTDLESGVPAIRIALENDLWTVPTGDKREEEYARIWQSEMSAYGWKDGKLMGLGEHDDTVMATYFVERGIRTVEEWLRHAAEEDDEFVTGEDLGIERPRIVAEYPGYLR